MLRIVYAALIYPPSQQPVNGGRQSINIWLNAMQRLAAGTVRSRTVERSGAILDHRPRPAHEKPVNRSELENAQR
jgi:hypothetical protein